MSVNPSFYLSSPAFPKTGCRVLFFFFAIMWLTSTQLFSPWRLLPPLQSAPPAALAGPPSAQGPLGRKACASCLSRRTCAQSAQQRRAQRSFTVLSGFSETNQPSWLSQRTESARRAAGKRQWTLCGWMRSYVSRVKEVWFTPVASSSRCCFLETRSWEDISRSNWVSSCFLHTALKNQNKIKKEESWLLISLRTFLLLYGWDNELMEGRNAGSTSEPQRRKGIL